ncbi:hypothetical protein CIPAW_06G026600 [Carya illinoinensis]|uniref:Glutathione S-transferase T3-like n=1 Tax=Carya illinoinensis TaxID=32201 RepID=A0A8T1Q750_CARIL|nr:hypothetical protein CIPAW_06G026600 [Carya illinoinensis]
MISMEEDSEVGLLFCEDARREPHENLRLINGMSGSGSKAWRGDIKGLNRGGLKFFCDGQGFMSVEMDKMDAEIIFNDVFGRILHRWRTSNFSRTKLSPHSAFLVQLPRIICKGCLLQQTSSSPSCRCNLLIDWKVSVCSTIHADACDRTPTQHDNVVVQATPNDGEKRHFSKKVQRGAFFTVEEENLLVSTWLNISIDAIRGTDQKSTQMWERITIFYHEYKKSNIANRSEGSLMNRWFTIQKWTNKFCAYIAQVESLHPSGATEQDKIEKAKVLYKEIVGSNFTMEHCWYLLSHQPKWQQHISTVGKKRKSPEKVTNIVDVDQAEEDIEVLAERPPGKKAEKERERKRKSMEGNDGEIKTALAKMTEDRATTIEERRNATLKADLERSAIFELKKKKIMKRK